jgi:hypothetical protein
MISTKPGVRLFGLTPEMLWALDRASDAYEVFGENVVVTSARGDRHSKYSLHYSGNAVDLRTRGITQEKIDKIVELLKHELGERFDVVLETSHLHLEHDPHDCHAYPSRFPYE